MDHLSELAAFVATAEAPDDVRAKTALILADTVAAMAGGAAEAEVRTLTARLAGGAAPGAGTGAAPVVGAALLATPAVAALLNGTAGTTLEMDEGNQFCKGHPAIHVIPAILSAASCLPTSCSPASCAPASCAPVTGAALLDAIAVGYEAAARVGIATALRPSMHPHGTWGAIGAAAGVLRLRGAPAADIREAMNMAASLGLTTSRRTMLEGGTVRNVFAGVSNQMGLLAADLSATGYTGDHDGVGHVFGKVASDSFAPEALSDALGSRWEVMRNYFKMHSCCRFNHAALDALALIRADAPDLSPDRIDRIEVDSYGLAAELDDPAPRNVLAAKFSVPFAMATVLREGSSGVGSFTADRVADPETLALAARVTVREDPSMSAMLPERRPARVTVILTDGTRLERATETNRGDWADPYPAADIRAKYDALSARVWPAPHAEVVWTLIHGLPAATGIAPLLRALAD